MLLRIVKMIFDPNRTDDFIKAFELRRNLIASFEGCQGVELLRDINQPNIFFTYSTWQSEAALEKYRQSELFTTTWDEVKQLFAGKPEAWSVEQLKQPGTN
jgi:quinol monooxygenase YgiN